MPDGFDVQPQQLRAGAVALRTDAVGLVAAERRARRAAQSAAQGAGEGPLSGAANELSAQLDRTVDAIRRSIEATAAAMDTASADYETSDSAAARGLGVGLPGS